MYNFISLFVFGWMPTCMLWPFKKNAFQYFFFCILGTLISPWLMIITCVIMAATIILREFQGWDPTCNINFIELLKYVWWPLLHCTFTVLLFSKDWQPQHFDSNKVFWETRGEGIYLHVLKIQYMNKHIYQMTHTEWLSCTRSSLI